MISTEPTVLIPVTLLTGFLGSGKTTVLVPQLREDGDSRFRRGVHGRARGAFDDVEYIGTVPTPFMSACDGHPLAPIAGSIVRDRPGTAVGRLGWVRRRFTAFAPALRGLAVSHRFGHPLQAGDDTGKQATATVT